MYYHWTIDAQGQKKVNRGFEDKQSYADSKHEYADSFSVCSGYYTLYCVLDEVSHTLKLTVKNPSGESPGSDTLSSQDIADPAGDGHGSSEETRTTLTNDTCDLIAIADETGTK